MLDKNSYVHLANGKFAGTTPEDLDEAFRQFRRQSPASGLVIHFHGGLVNQRSALKLAEDLGPQYEAAGAFPYFFVWETGPWETIRNNLWDIAQEPFFQHLVAHLVDYIAGKLGFGFSEAVTDASPFDQVTAWFRSQDTRPPFDQRLAGLEGQTDPEIDAQQLAARFAADPVFIQAVDQLNQLVSAEPSADESPAAAATMVSSEFLDELTKEQGPRSSDEGVFALISISKVAWVASQIGLRIIKRFWNGRDHGLWTTVVEEVLRKCYGDKIGRAFFWNQMKNDTADAFQHDPDEYVGTRFVAALKQLIDESDTPPRVTLVGHSAGCIFVSNLLIAAHRVLPSNFKFDVVLLAPAVDFDLFQQAQTTSRIGNLRMFGMSDPLESADALLAGAHQSLKYLYPRSLLYFVAGLLETEVDRPLVGMQRYHSEPQYRGRLFASVNRIRQLFAVPGKAVWSIADDGVGRQSSSRRHGDFDREDPPTVASVMHIVQHGFGISSTTGALESVETSEVDDVRDLIAGLEDDSAVEVLSEFADHQYKSNKVQVDFSSEIQEGLQESVVSVPQEDLLSDGQVARQTLQVAADSPDNESLLRELISRPAVRHPRDKSTVSHDQIWATIQSQFKIAKGRKKKYEMSIAQHSSELSAAVSDLLRRGRRFPDKSASVSKVSHDDLRRALKSLSPDDLRTAVADVVPAEFNLTKESVESAIESALQHLKQSGISEQAALNKIHRKVPTAYLRQRFGSASSKASIELTQSPVPDDANPQVKSVGNASPIRSMLIALNDANADLSNIPGIQVLSKVGTIVAARGTPECIQQLETDERVLSIDASQSRASAECQLSLPFIKATDAHSQHGEKGNRALVAIIDSGVDVLHHAFRSGDQTRIHAVWDLSDDTGPAPPGFALGTLHTRDDINRYLANGAVEKNLGQDPRGHGTHVASIAAGSPVSAFSFPGGVAPESPLLIVVTGENMTFEDDSPSSLGYSITHNVALDYIDTVATELGLPVVVNVSQGMQSGSHDGTTLLEVMFDNFCLSGRKPGRVVVKSAGNDRLNSGHAQITLSSGFLEFLSWTSDVPRPSAAFDRKHDVIELWFDPIGEIAFQLVNPNVESTPTISQPDNGFQHSFSDGNIAKLSYEDNFRDNGLGRIRIEIQNGTAGAIKDGRWQLEFVAGSLTDNLVIDAWVDRTDNLPVRFINRVKEETTLSVPGTAQSVITVGATSSKTPVQVWQGSACGPTRVGEEKPDIVAPGWGVQAAHAGSSVGLRGKTGTSMAAPHVTGAIALMLSAAGKKSPPKELNSNQIREILKRTAQHGRNQWDRATGFGVINVEQAVDQAKK